MSGRDFDIERLHLRSQLTEFRRLVAELPEDEILMLVSTRARIELIERDLARLEAEMASGLSTAGGV